MRKMAAMDMLDGETEIRDYALERAIMLSDGVFAIAMTLLALDLRPPPDWNHTVSGLLDGIAIPFQAFFWSFFAAASFWIAHRRLFGVYRRADSAITIINLVLLGEVVLIPAATRVLTEMHHTPDALALYLGLFAMIGFTNAASWLYAAFLTDIVRPPKRGPALSISIALIYALVPVSMTALGVSSSTPGHLWMLAPMPFVMLAAYGLRWLARAVDRRWARPPLPAEPVAGQVEPEPG